MVYLKQIYVENNKAGYFYQPEGKGRFGEVIYDIENESIEILKGSEEESEGNQDLYIRHLLNRLNQFKKDNNFAKEEVVDW